MILIFGCSFSFSLHRVDKKRDKLERKVLDSQERAFWDVHRPVVRANIVKLQRCLDLIDNSFSFYIIRCRKKARKRQYHRDRYQKSMSDEQTSEKLQSENLYGLSAENRDPKFSFRYLFALVLFTAASRLFGRWWPCQSNQ